MKQRPKSGNRYMIVPLLCFVWLWLLFAISAGCQRGDFRASMVIRGQPAPHAGYNVGPEIYVLPGDPCPVTGAVIWIRGLDPNDIGRYHGDI